MLMFLFIHAITPEYQTTQCVSSHISSYDCNNTKFQQELSLTATYCHYLTNHKAFTCPKPDVQCIKDLNDEEWVVYTMFYNQNQLQCELYKVLYLVYKILNQTLALRTVQSSIQNQSQSMESVLYQLNNSVDVFELKVNQTLKSEQAMIQMQIVQHYQYITKSNLKVKSQILEALKNISTIPDVDLNTRTNEIMQIAATIANLGNGSGSIIFYIIAILSLESIFIYRILKQRSKNKQKIKAQSRVFVQLQALKAKVEIFYNDQQ